MQESYAALKDSVGVLCLRCNCSRGVTDGRCIPDCSPSVFVTPGTRRRSAISRNFDSIALYFFISREPGGRTCVCRCVPLEGLVTLRLSIPLPTIEILSAALEHICAFLSSRRYTSTLCPRLEPDTVESTSDDCAGSDGGSGDKVRQHLEEAKAVLAPVVAHCERLEEEQRGEENCGARSWSSQRDSRE